MDFREIEIKDPKAKKKLITIAPGFLIKRTQKNCFTRATRRSSTIFIVFLLTKKSKFS